MNCSYSFGGFLSTGYNANVALFTFVGEVLLMGWLLWKGLRLRKLLPRSKRGVVLTVVVAAAIVVLPIGVALLYVNGHGGRHEILAKNELLEYERK